MKTGENVYIADGAKVVGDVTLNDGVGVWYNAVIRGDHGKIVIGDNTNVQDNCTIHTEIGHDMTIGAGVSIGHGAVCHGEFIGDNTLIGTKVGHNCIVGAGALLTQNTEVPDGSLVFGSPAKVIRPLTPEEKEGNRENCERYLHLAVEALEKKE